MLYNTNKIGFAKKQSNDMCFIIFSVIAQFKVREGQTSPQRSFTPKIDYKRKMDKNNKNHE